MKYPIRLDRNTPTICAHNRVSRCLRLLSRALTIVSAMALSFGESMADGAVRFVGYPDKFQIIDTTKEHYTVTLISMFVATNDNLFKVLLSNATHGVVSIKAEGTFFDGQSMSMHELHDMQNLGANVNKVVPLNINILEDIPGDAKATITANVAIYKESRISEVLSALDSSKSALVSGGAEALSAPWIGYVKVVSSIVDKLFGTNEKNFPFRWKGDIKLNDGSVFNAGLLKEHYIILLSPSKTNDAVNIDPKLLKFDGTSQRLTLDGKPLDRWSYAVLRVSKGNAINIAQIAFSSNAPWAVVLQSQFWPPTLPEVSNQDDVAAQVRAAVDIVVKQLDNLAALLKEERRFSAYDRATTLRAMALNAQTSLTASCKASGGDLAKCGIDRLDLYAKNIAVAFGLVTPGQKALGKILPIEDSLSTRAQGIASEISARINSQHQ